jgi:tetratricopeptide (TPR) repeat protein
MRAPRAAVAALALLACGAAFTEARADARGDAVRAFEQRQDRAALERFEALASAAPDDAELQNYLGRARLRAGQVNEGVAALERAVKLAPDNSTYHLNLSGGLGQQVELVGVFKKMGIAGRVKDHIERAVALAPDSVRAREALMQFYAQAPGIAGGSMDKAREQVAHVMRTNTSVGLRMQASLARIEKKPDAEITAAWEQAVAADDAEGTARFAYATYLTSRERWDEAFVQLEALAKLRPGAPAVKYQLGRAAALSGKRLAEGEAALKSYLETGPQAEGDLGRDAAHWRLGMVLEKAGRRDEARAQYQASLKENPGFKQAREALDKLD